MNEQTNERTDGRMDGWTNERKSTCVLQDFVPFGAAAQKGRNRRTARRKECKKGGKVGIEGKKEEERKK